MVKGLICAQVRAQSSCLCCKKTCNYARENHAVHLRAAVCEVWCNRVVRRRGFMRPLHRPRFSRERRARPLKLEETPPNFLPRPSRSRLQTHCSAYYLLFTNFLDLKKFILTRRIFSTNSYTHRLPRFLLIKTFTDGFINHIIA